MLERTRLLLTVFVSRERKAEGEERGGEEEQMVSRYVGLELEASHT